MPSKGWSVVHMKFTKKKHVLVDLVEIILKIME